MRPVPSYGFLASVILALAALAGGCDNQPDRKPANAPRAPELQDVLHDAGDVTTFREEHPRGAVTGEGAAAGTGAGATTGDTTGQVPVRPDGGAAAAGDAGGTPLVRDR